MSKKIKQEKIITKPFYDICCIEGCEVKVRSSHCKWCEKHYYRNRRNGDPEKLHLCQYKVDEKIFDEWNDSTAWLIGLLWTDGWMSKGNSVGLRLKDVQLIETAKKELHTNVEIKDRFDSKGRQYKSFSIANKYLADKLREKGMHRNKTFTIEYPKNMPDELFGPFFRGVIDGDGTVWLKKRRKGQQVKDCRVSFVSASKVFVEQIQEQFKKRNINFSIAVKTKYLKNGKLCSTWMGNNLWRVIISHIDSLRNLYKMMYPTLNVPCLHRKRDSFHEWYITPRVTAGNPNMKLGFWTEKKLKQLKPLYLDPNGSIEEMISIFDCTWDEILWAANKKLGLKRPCYWTKTEDFVLQEHYSHSSWSTILELLPNRNKSSISQRASKLEIIRPRTIRPERGVLFDLYHIQNMSIKQIGIMYKAAPETVRGWFKHHDIPRKQKIEKWSNEEIERLTNMYPIAIKEEILEMFPNRSWKSIIAYANKKLNLKSKVVLSRKTLNDYVIEAERLASQFGKLPMASILNKTHSSLAKVMIKNPEVFNHIAQEKSNKKHIEYWVNLAEQLQRENNGILYNAGWLQKNGHKALDAAMRRQPDKFSHIKQHRKTKVMSEEVRAKVSAIRKGKPWSNKRRQASIQKV